MVVRLFRARWGAALLMMFVLAACSGLGGEPRIVATLPPVTPAPTDVGHPAELPDMAVGAALFSQNCTACHGLNGAGDGQLVQAGQVGNPGNFTLPDAARQQRPTAWFSTITNGRIENLMPPWHDALTETERWAVAFYTYTLHYERAALEQGRTLYSAHCAECHGEGGLGDGERAARVSGGVPSLLDLEEMSLISDQTIYYGVTEGIAEVMPAFADELTEDERWAVSEYTRTLMLAQTDSLGVAKAAQQAFEQNGAAGDAVPVTTPEADENAVPVATPEADANPAPAALGIVSGQISNGTAGGTVPGGLTVNLFILTNESGLVQQLETTSDEAGRYTVLEAPLDPSYQYIAGVTYRENVYTSSITPGSAITAEATITAATASAGSTLDLPIVIYDLTDDPSLLRISGVVTQVTVVEGDANAAGSLEIAQVFDITNTGDRAYTSTQTTDDGRPVSLVFTLPPGALIAGFGEENRFVISQDQFAFVDTRPVLPGAGTLVQVVYFIPYPGDAIIEQEAPYAIAGPVRLLVRPAGMRVQGDQFPSLGVEQIGQSEFSSYGGTLALGAGEVLRYEISGSGLSAASAATSDAVSGDTLPLVLILGIGLEILVVIGLYAWYRRRRAQYWRNKTALDIPAAPAPGAGGGLPDDAVREMLIAEIAALDADYEAGRLDAETHRAQRAALKARLSSRLQK